MPRGSRGILVLTWDSRLLFYSFFASRRRQETPATSRSRARIVGAAPRVLKPVFFIFILTFVCLRVCRDDRLTKGRNAEHLLSGMMPKVHPARGRSCVNRNFYRFEKLTAKLSLLVARVWNKVRAFPAHWDFEYALDVTLNLAISAVTIYLNVVSLFLRFFFCFSEAAWENDS